MAKKYPTPEPNPQMVRMGFVHENVVCDSFGYSWSTWEREFRTKFPGRITPTGRWFHEDQVVEWFKSTAKTSSEVTE
ncbi:hypothetical protein CEE69_09465 [Rhodopirellula bahusiensis]|uniref:AlpA family phage regulatory protein n=1 Tax=Rhodopirellula bahusiensis TaxID=2014065 RepID=A0A2G1W9U9_9BACT|nr:hypothetical protein CEE69_09465 [Rhodopirellula bahusiensis]